MALNVLNSVHDKLNSIHLNDNKFAEHYSKIELVSNCATS